MFAGWSQRLRIGRVQLGHDLQVDRDPDTDTWRIAQLQVRSSIPLARGLDLNARYSTRQPSVLTPLGNLISSRREQVSGGLSFWARGTSIRGDVTANRFEGGDFTYTYSSSFSVVRTPFMGVGFNGSGSYWRQRDAKAFVVTGGVSRTFGRVVSRASYQQYRSESSGNTLLTHAVDVSLTVPFSRKVSLIVRGRTQRGENLTNNNLYVSLWTNF
jgi:outer membrane usher protein FimD/PapC